MPVKCHTKGSYITRKKPIRRATMRETARERERDAEGMSVRKLSLWRQRSGFFPDEKKERRAIVKNVVKISSGFTLLFTAYGATGSLQSSINQAQRVISIIESPDFQMYFPCLTNGRHCVLRKTAPPRWQPRTRRWYSRHSSCPPSSSAS